MNIDSSLSILLTIFSYLIVLAIVVFVHEFGHFQVAKWLGVKIEKFSIGFGKELLSWKDREGVIWRIALLPLGGYVKFFGDKDGSSFPDENISEDTDNALFHNKPVWVRALVTLAGPMFNFFFAIFIFTVLLFSFGDKYQKPFVDSFMENSAAQTAGIQVKDEIIAINGKKTESVQDVIRMVMTSGGQQLSIDVKRNDQILSLTATPNVVEVETPFGTKESQGLLGIKLKSDKIYEKKYNIIEAGFAATRKCGEIIETQINFISALFRGAMSTGHLSGPLGIAQTTGLVAKTSIDSAGVEANFGDKAASLALALISLSAFISIAIGFMNLIPLPILDGGHLVFYAYEAIRGKPVPLHIQTVFHKMGFFLLLALFVFATTQDFNRYLKIW